MGLKDILKVVYFQLAIVWPIFRYYDAFEFSPSLNNTRLVYGPKNLNSDLHFGFLGRPKSRRLLDLPEGVKHQSKEEIEYLKLHKCMDHGEVYSASYLITKEHLLKHRIDYNLSECNTELASFMVMDTRMDPDRDQDGTLIQSLDVLDFSVVHLSAFERLQRRHNTKSRKLEAIKNATKLIEQFTNSGASSSILSLYFNQSSYGNRTIAVMPFLGSEVGAGNSIVANRLEYLKACFWSLHMYFNKVVVVVKSEKDRIIAM